MKTKMNKETMKKIAVKYLIVIALAALTAAYIYKNIEVSKNIDTIKSGEQVNKVQLDDEMRKKFNIYNSKQATVVEKYKQRIEDCIHHSFSEAKNGAKDFSSKMGEVSYILKLSYLFAYDKIMNKNSSTEEIDSKISSYITVPITNMIDQVESLIGECYKELAKNHTEFKLDVEEQLSNCPSAKELKIRMDEIDNALSEIQSGTIEHSLLFSMTIAVEGITIKQTTMSAVRLLKPIVTKMSVAIISSISDGVMVIGDLCGVLLTAISVYDVYNIKVQMPQEIEATLINELSVQENKFIQDIFIYLDSTLKEFEQ